MTKFFRSCCGATFEECLSSFFIYYTNIRYVEDILYVSLTLFGMELWLSVDDTQNTQLNKELYICELIFIVIYALIWWVCRLNNFKFETKFSATKMILITIITTILQSIIAVQIFTTDPKKNYPNNMVKRRLWAYYLWFAHTLTGVWWQLGL